MSHKQISEGIKAFNTPLGLLSGKKLDYYDEKGEELGYGTFSVVKKYNTSNGPKALKIINISNSGHNASMLQEAASLVLMDHPNVVKLEDIAFLKPNPKDEEPIYRTLFVLPLAEDSLYKPILAKKLTLRENKSIALQLLRAVAYIQSKDILHGDYKPSNILIYDCEGIKRVVVADFGISRTNRCYNLTIKDPVFTLWYRPPEILLGGNYTSHGDIWAIGAIILELYINIPAFPGDSEIDLLYRMFRTLGTPTEESWPGVSTLPEYKPIWPVWKEKGIKSLIPDTNKERDVIVDLLSKMVVLDPNKRSNALDLMKHPFFNEVRGDLDKSCLKAESVLSIDCKVHILEHQAEERHSPLNKSKDYIFTNVKKMITIAEKFRIPDRALILAIYLMKKYNGLLLVSDKESKKIFLTCLIITSSLLTSEPFDAYTASQSFEIKEEELIKCQTEILSKVGLDLYASTAYDILYVLGDVYTQNVRDTALTFLLLIQYITVDVTPHNIALSMIALACGVNKEKFVHKIESSTFLIVVRALQSLISELSSDFFKKDLCKRGVSSTLHAIQHCAVLAPYLEIK